MARRRRRINKTKKNVMRCKNHTKPVFGNEVCNDFVSNQSSSEEKKCKNCKYSF